MSKIGKNPVQIPSGVTVKLTGNTLEVQGPKWALSQDIYPGVDCVVSDKEITFSCKDEKLRQYRGTMRSLADNMVYGVTTWYTTTLQVIGVGFSASLQGSKLVLKLGFSHPVEFDLPAGVSAAVRQDPKWNALIDLTSHDKQLIGQTAAKLRSLRKPEPYKGKGIRYLNEVVKIKAGKTATKE